MLCVLQVKALVYVEIGRVVVINYGPQTGKLAVIVDVVDQARVSAHSSSSDAARREPSSSEHAARKRAIDTQRSLDMLCALCCASATVASIAPFAPPPLRLALSTAARMRSAQFASIRCPSLPIDSFGCDWILDGSAELCCVLAAAAAPAVLAWRLVLVSPRCRISLELDCRPLLLCPSSRL